MKEPFNQALPVLQQFHHILNEILFPGGVSVTFGNVMTMGVTLCGLACVISMGNAVHTITAELRKAQKVRCVFFIPSLPGICLIY